MAKTMDDIPDKQWWAMCNAQLSEPVALAQADLSKPFVYQMAPSAPSIVGPLRSNV